MNSPIIYFGGKSGNMLNSIMSFFPEHNSYDMYCELFCGGAGCFFHKDESKFEILNDLNKNIYSLFSVLQDKEKLKIFKEKCDSSIYHEEIREEFNRSLIQDNLDDVERAYKYFYVNKSSYHGSGGFSVKNTIRGGRCRSIHDFWRSIDKLPEVYERLQNAVIYSRDALELIKKYDNEPTFKVFMYLDSPYHYSTRTSTRYDVDMDNDKQKEYIDTLLTVKNAKVLVSGYDCKEYERLVDSGIYKKIDIEVNRQDGARNPKKVIESIWKNY